MRNLKRALSLALAAVMVIGMMVVGAGAVSINDFSDADEIVNKDAVSMVTALGIINGLPGGSYGPTQNIDRASFTKMVAMTYNGGKEPMLPASNKVSYTDTGDNWAKQYIEYCTNLGFVSGDGTTGKFNPGAPVTISQAAKMLLTALGYNAAIEGYVGYDWQMNVDSAANTVGLYSGLSGDTSANATRDQAAQMIYNALSATMVKYEYVISGINASTSQASAKPQVTTNGMRTLLEEKFEAVKVTAVVLGNEYADLTGSRTAEGKTRVKIIEQPRNNNVNIEVEDGVYTVASDPDMLGKSVTMFVKMSGGSTAPARATVLGNLIVSEDNKVVELSSKKDTTAKISDFLKGEGLKTDNNTEYYTNFVSRNSLTNQKGEVISFIDYDNNGYVDYALQSIKTFGKVDAYSTSGDGSLYVSSINPSANIRALVASDITILNINTTDATGEVVGFEDVAKDDYVFFYQLMGDDSRFYVEKAEYVEVTVTAIRGDKVTADGKSYEASGLINKFGENDDQTLGAMVDLKDEVRLYLDSVGNVVYTDSVNSTTDYLYVTGSDRYNDFRDTLEVKAIFADGTTATVDVKAKDGSINLSNNQQVSDGIYTYSKNSKDVYTLTAVTGAESTSLSGATINRGQANVASTGIVANNSTIFVVQRGTSGSYSVYTGVANVPDMTGVTGEIASKRGTAKIVFITTSSLTGNPEGIYVLDADPYVTSNGDDKLYTYDVIYNGEKTALTYDNSRSPFTSGEGYYTDVDISGTEIVAVNLGALAQDRVGFVQASEAIKASNGVVQNRGQGTAFTYTDKTVFLIADGLDVTEASVGAITADTNNQIDGSMIAVIPDTDNANVAATVVICK